jgi:hypothetical protein
MTTESKLEKTGYQLRLDMLLEPPEAKHEARAETHVPSREAGLAWAFEEMAAHKAAAGVLFVDGEPVGVLGHPRYRDAIEERLRLQLLRAIATVRPFGQGPVGHA